MKKLSNIIAILIMLTSTLYSNSYATTNTDLLYKNAYDATISALELRTQDSINVAREAISKLPTDMDWAIGEFSKQIDTVQHPILVDIVNAIKNAQYNPNQNNINIAKRTIPDNLPDIWRSSYSSAVDIIQQELQIRLVQAIENAEATKTSASVTAARNLVNDILTAEDKDMKAWAQLMEQRLNKVVIFDLDGFMSEVEQRIYELVDEERAKAGVNKLSYSPTMEKYARIKSKDMGDNDYFSHEDLNGNLITVQMLHDGISFRAWGENIAYISTYYAPSAEAAAMTIMDLWMNSSGHKANILSTKFDSIGIGVYKINGRIYATQEFYR